MLDYASATGATSAAAAAIKNAYLSGVKGAGNLGRVLAVPAPDPYMAWLDAYTWGSNQIKGAFGNLFCDIVARHLDSATDADARRAAERYIHYLHGVNPLALVYLSNMNDHGAEKSVTQFFHTWFANGSAKWDQVGVSTYGPSPRLSRRRPEPLVRLGWLLPERVRHGRVHRRIRFTSQGAARSEIVQGLQCRLAARLVVGDRALGRLSGEVHSPPVEVRAVSLPRSALLCG